MRGVAAVCGQHHLAAEGNHAEAWLRVVRELARLADTLQRLAAARSELAVEADLADAARTELRTAHAGLRAEWPTHLQTDEATTPYEAKGMSNTPRGGPTPGRSMENTGPSLPRPVSINPAWRSPPMSDSNNAQTAVAAYCTGDIGLGDRLVESAAAAQQGLEMEDGTVLSGEQTVALLRARAISDALDVVNGRLESWQGVPNMVERISGVRDRLLVEHEPAYQTDKRLFLADTPRQEESLGYSTVEDRYSRGEGLDAGVLSDRASQIASPGPVTGEPAAGPASSEPDPDFDRPAEPPIGYGE